jgi:hypothetical protein
VVGLGDTCRVLLTLTGGNGSVSTRDRATGLKKPPKRRRYRTQGRSRTYHALFAFGKDDKGQEAIQPVDTVIGNSILSAFVNRPLYPATLLNTSMREDPAVATWLKAHQVFDATCKPGKEDVCCDLNTLECGVSAHDVNAAFSQPIPASETVPVNRLRGGAQAAVSNAEPYDCSLNNISEVVPDHFIGTEQHKDGDHEFDTRAVGSCTYTGSSSCRVLSTVQMGTSDKEFGTVSGFCHEFGTNSANGAASGASATSTGVAGVAIETCIACFCSAPTIGIKGVSVSFPTGTIFQHSTTFQMGCTQVSPIIIDPTGHGYHLTSAQNGVIFDMKGDGHPVQTAWTASNSGDGFLALDRNGNGVIDSGKELFGDFTDQPPSNAPNGFLALAVFDKPENGGNGDGMIDARDKVWPSLRLWIDENHDGISQPGELHKLDDLGIHSLDLKYTLSERKDEFGNVFRYKGKINPEGQDDGVQRVIWDVFLIEE